MPYSATCSSNSVLSLKTGSYERGSTHKGLEIRADEEVERTFSRTLLGHRTAPTRRVARCAPCTGLSFCRYRRYTSKWALDSRRPNTRKSVNEQVTIMHISLQVTVVQAVLALRQRLPNLTQTSDFLSRKRMPRMFENIPGAFSGCPSSKLARGGTNGLQARRLVRRWTFSASLSAPWASWRSLTRHVEYAGHQERYRCTAASDE